MVLAGQDSSRTTQGSPPCDPVITGRSGQVVIMPSPLTTFSSPARRSIQCMAYDERLAGRIRALLDGEAGVTEKRMFGGLAFLVGGNMAVAASGQGGLLVRADPATSDHLLTSTGVHPMEMRGRQMQNWLRVDDDAVRTKRQLEKWVRIGAGYAGSLPPKR
jgi:TfoX/Sxy family transcriptional regulator of competence genes